MKKLTNLIFKNRGKRKKTLLVVLILVCILFLPTSFAHANIFEDAIKVVLIGVFYFVGWLFSIAATLFAFVIDPANISAEKTGILNKQAIRDVWIMTRDVLNMTFIMVLLFSAFCTIFQIEKWNIRKVWLNILIFALLVNFSYAIARFIIDISNVAMYYFLDNMFSYSGNMNGGDIFSQFGGSSKIGNLVLPQAYSSTPVSYLLAMIIFVFILGMTLLIIAVLFVVRLIALAILIMFAPIGFVGYIFPETSGYASKWWKQLFSYSFFAPIMVFMMGVALQVTKAIGDENMTSFNNAARLNSSGQDKWIAQAAFFSIPIVILWMGMGIAKGMSIAGAGVITDKAQGIAKGVGMWATKKFSGYNWMKKNYDQFKSKRDEREKEIDKKRFGGRWGKGLNKFEDTQIGRLPGKLGEKARNRNKDVINKALAEDVDKAKDDYATTPSDVLVSHLSSTINRDAAMNNRAAAVQFLARHKEFMGDAGKRAEHDAKIDADIRNDIGGAMTALKATTAYTSATNDVERQAVIESHIKAQVAKSYSTMGAHASAVRGAHTIK